MRFLTLKQNKLRENTTQEKKLTLKKHSTINNWVKSENPELPNNQQKLTQLDIGWEIFLTLRENNYSEFYQVM